MTTLAHTQTAGVNAKRVAINSIIKAATVGAIGLGLLVVESVVLSRQGIQGGAVSLIAVLAASTLCSIAGFAFSALCGALLFHIIESPVYAVEVMTICSIAIQMLSVATLWHSIDWRSLPVYLVGGVLGVPAGVYLLLRQRTWSLRTAPLSDACAGFLGGLTGGLAAFPGAFVTIWCSLKGWDKARQRGVYQPFILSMQPVTLIAIYLMRPASSTAAQMDWKVLVFVPAALLGAWFGLNIFKRLSDRQFELAVCALLVFSGIGLIA